MATPKTTMNEKKYLDFRRAARGYAVQILYQLDAGDEADMKAETLERFWEQLDRQEQEKELKPNPTARKLAERFVRGVAENNPELDRLINACAQNWRVTRMSFIDRNILRLAAYEIKHCPDIPPKATLNEAIELAKAYGDKDSPRFVNGLLDNLLRQQD
ncbi:MAG: transcription antitermination factor NusB [Lentisphaeria bacterium]